MMPIKNSLKVNIRKATEEDFPRILELIKEFAGSQNLEDKVSNSVDLMKAEQDSFNCLVAEKDNQIIAFANFFFSYYTWTGKSLYLEDMYVTKQYRGQQVGTAIMNEIIEIAKAENCKKVRWQVANWNQKAIDFYKEFGADIGDVEINCDLKLQ